MLCLRYYAGFNIFFDHISAADFPGQFHVTDSVLIQLDDWISDDILMTKEIYYHGEITPRPVIEPVTPRLQILNCLEIRNKCRWLANLCMTLSYNRNTSAMSCLVQITTKASPSVCPSEKWKDGKVEASVSYGYISCL